MAEGGGVENHIRGRMWLREVTRVEAYMRASVAYKRCPGTLLEIRGDLFPSTDLRNQ